RRVLFRSKELLVRLDRPYFLTDGRIIGLALGNGMVEDSGVGGEPGDRQLVDVALERAARQQIAGDVVEREALTGLTELQWCCCLHDRLLFVNLVRTVAIPKS